ncbi:MAG: DUF2911 domain-containing protein [Lewinellaceae bacterium]|nr:DUF2911 domain-containing protein [Lewinellaceae bacterium]
MIWFPWRMWRTGANAATSFTFGDDVKVGGVATTTASMPCTLFPVKKNGKSSFTKTPISGEPRKDCRESDVAARFSAIPG